MLSHFFLHSSKLWQPKASLTLCRYPDVSLQSSRDQLLHAEFLSAICCAVSEPDLIGFIKTNIASSAKTISIRRTKNLIGSSMKILLEFRLKYISFFLLRRVLSLYRCGDAVNHLIYGADKVKACRLRNRNNQREKESQ